MHRFILPNEGYDMSDRGTTQGMYIVKLVNMKCLIQLKLNYHNSENIQTGTQNIPRILETGTKQLLGGLGRR